MAFDFLRNWFVLMSNPFQAAEAVVLVAEVEVEEVEAAEVAVSKSTSVQLTVDALCKYSTSLNS